LSSYDAKRPVAVQEAFTSDPRLERVSKFFERHFQTTHARVEEVNKSQYSHIYLNPDKNFSSEYNMTHEVLCVCVDYTEVEARTLSYIDSIIQKENLRLDTDCAFLISNSENSDAMCRNYMDRTGRKIVSFTWRDVEGAGDEYAAEVLRQFFYSHDFFDVTDPVSADNQFFARFKLIDDIYSSLRSGQNMGIFGLRRIGKTSIIERLIIKNRLQTKDKFTIALIDAQKPHIYQGDAASVILDICRALNSAWASEYGSTMSKDIPKNATLVEASRFGQNFLNSMMQQNRKLLLIIDELERILPNANRMSHWNTDYLPLWRFLRGESITSEGKFVFLLASTNPFFVEEAAFQGEDNPLHRFVRPVYLPMFMKNDIALMLRDLGKKMAVVIDDEAIDLIYSEYGGHPFLSRQFCSFISRELAERPLHLNKDRVKKSIDRFHGQLRADLDAILKIFQDYYPDEYTLFESIAKNSKKARQELMTHSPAARHLLGYGLLRETKNNYVFSMSALNHYFSTESPKRFKIPEVPDNVTQRHLQLQSSLNKIEPQLRSIIMNELRKKYKKAWQAEVQRHSINESDQLVKVYTNGMTLMEDIYFPQLFQIISANWTLFAGVFGDKHEFKEKAALAENARRMSDHRKISDCDEDAKFIPALSACEWFEEKLLS
jgi:AAA+ ATPase superfamily predicted ATPase